MTPIASLGIWFICLSGFAMIVLALLLERDRPDAVLWPKLVIPSEVGEPLLALALLCFCTGITMFVAG